MSCNKDIFKYQEMVARNTWIEHLKNEGIDVFIYTSGDENIIIDDKIYCNIEDDVYHTYEKTIKALKQINTDEYDFIVRTNLTTYVNAKLLKLYCEFLNNNNFDIANGGLCLKNDIIHYRGNSLIMNNKVIRYLLDNIYPNNEHMYDDEVYQNIFKNIENLRIHSVPFRYYSNEGHFSYHPQAIHKINKELCEGIVFISYRIIKSNDLEKNLQDDFNRYIELGRCYEIDSIYDSLENLTIGNNFNLLAYDLEKNLFIRGKYILQKNNTLEYCQSLVNKNDLNIYVCAYKDFNMSNIPNKDYYKVLNYSDCNNDLNDIKLLYSEYYHFYEIWKNIDIPNFIGLCHYRRFLNVSDEDIEDLKNNNVDMILPKKYVFGISNYKQYTQNFNKEFLVVVGAIIKKYYPDYLQTYCDFFNDNKLYSNSIFITRKDIFLDYCKFIFDIFDKFGQYFKFNSIADVYNYIDNNSSEFKFKGTKLNDMSKDKYEEMRNNFARIYGFLGERLLNVYVTKNNLKTKEVDMSIYDKE